MANFSSGRIVLVGDPNVGKSSLFNRIIGTDEQIVTPKIHTTQKTVQLQLPNLTAVEVVDTPGRIPPRRRRQNKLLSLQSVGALDNADLGLAVFDCKRLIRWHSQFANLPDGNSEAIMDVRANSESNPTISLIEYCRASSCPVIAIMNKVDLIKDRAVLLQLAKALYDTGAFTEVIPVSCERKRGLNELVSYLSTDSPEMTNYFEKWQEQNSNRGETNPLPKERLLPTQHYITERIREQFFKHYRSEIPYITAVQIEKVVETADRVQCWVRVIAKRRSHVGILLGKNGTRIGEVGRQARLKLQHLFDKKVDLMVRVDNKSKDTHNDEWVVQ